MTDWQVSKIIKAKINKCCCSATRWQTFRLSPSPTSNDEAKKAHLVQPLTQRGSEAANDVGTRVISISIKLIGRWHKARKLIVVGSNSVVYSHFGWSAVAMVLRREWLAVFSSVAYLDSISAGMGTKKLNVGMTIFMGKVLPSSNQTRWKINLPSFFDNF